MNEGMVDTRCTTTRPTSTYMFTERVIITMAWLHKQITIITIITMTVNHVGGDCYVFYRTLIMTLKWQAYIYMYNGGIVIFQVQH